MTRCIKTSKTNLWTYLNVSVPEDPCKSWNLVVALLRIGTFRSRPNQIGLDQCVRALITDFIWITSAKLRAGMTSPALFCVEHDCMLYCLVGRIFEQGTWPVSTRKLFRRVRIVPESDYYRRHIRLSACSCVATTGRISVKFNIEDFL
jgi:hypothetical protein